MYLRRHDASHIVWLTMTSGVRVIIATIKLGHTSSFFIRWSWLLLCPYVGIFIITVDEYLCVQLLPLCLFISCLYVGLGHFFVGFDLAHISTLSLVEGGLICRVYMCFHNIITSLNIKNNSP